MQYPLKAFNIDDRDLAIKIAGEVKFANIIFIHNNDIQVISAPVIICEEKGRQVIEGHLWRNNPIYGLLINAYQLKCKIIFNAANSYISPVVYNAKAITGDVVPTWNYLEVQFNGWLKKIDDNELLSTLSKQVAEFEAMVGGVWQITHASAQYIAKLQEVIFGFKLEIDSFTGTAKMSQNKSDADINNIVKWCNAIPKANKNLAYWHEILSKAEQ